MRNVFFLALLSGVFSAQAAYWHTDFNQAQTKAYGENRTMLVYFTSSDRGGTCARLQEEVFSTYEFQTFADRHLILVEVDFPRWKQLDPAQIIANRKLADKYICQGYPIVLILNNLGEPLGKMGYQPGGAKTYIQAIEQVARLSEKRGANRSEPAETSPLFSGAPTGPAPKYKDLTLKSISGSGTKRLALINNQTLAAGESGKVLLGESEVKIRCDEIRDASVLVTVEGKPGKRELHLSRTVDKDLPAQVTLGNPHRPALTKTQPGSR